MKRVFISSVQKEFELERAAIKRMIESDPILKPYFSMFVFEIDAPICISNMSRLPRILESPAPCIR